MIRESNTVIPALSFEYDSVTMQDPTLYNAFKREFNYMPVSWRLAGDVAAFCRRIQNAAKASGRELTKDEQTVIAIGRAVIVFIRQTIYGYLTPEDHDVGF